MLLYILGDPTRNTRFKDAQFIALRTERSLKSFSSLIQYVKKTQYIFICPTTTPKSIFDTFLLAACMWLMEKDFTIYSILFSIILIFKLVVVITSLLNWCFMYKFVKFLFSLAK